jgi:nitrite reductase/ring-hydroxylating ferredoxin subunit
MGRFLTRLIDAQARWARPLGDFNHRWLLALFRPLWPLKDFLNGRWLSHPLHSALTDVPVGALTVVVVLDLVDAWNLFGVGDLTLAADIGLLIGILSMLAAAVAGLADYTDTDGTPRLRATVHATIMVVALVVFVLALVIRAGNPVDRTFSIILVVVGYLLLTAGSYVGGDVAYVLGNMVNRHAFRGSGTKWIALELPPDAELVEGAPTKARLGINNLVLVRQGEAIHALHETCAHAGGPLAEGTVVDGCIQCPWHGSRFRITNGHAVRGPTVYDQPRYEVRKTETGWEGRRVLD